MFRFPSKAMLWIKEVEMVDSVDEKNHRDQFRSKDFPNFELLDARIASASNKIFQISYLKKKVSLENKKPRKRTDFFAEDRLRA